MPRPEATRDLKNALLPSRHWMVRKARESCVYATERKLAARTEDAASLIAMTIGAKLLSAGSLLRPTRAALIDQESGKYWLRNLLSNPSATSSESTT